MRSSPGSFSYAVHGGVLSSDAPSSLPALSGRSLNICLLVSCLVLLLYLALGGPTAAIYNGVPRFFLTVLGHLRRPS